MAETYNPIVRTYDELHEALTRILGLAESEVGADTELETLIPLAIRRATWRRIREQGVNVPGLELPQDQYQFLFFTVLMATVGLALWLWTWTALFFAIPIGFLAYWISRPLSVHFPIGIRTVGELAFYMTRFSDHKDSGHRWSPDEIALKVRMVLAESLGLPLERVQRENRMVDMENW